MRKSGRRQGQRSNGTKGLNVSGETGSLLRDTPTLSQDTASKTGLSPRIIQQHVQVPRSIPQDVRDAIRDTELADSKRELLSLARMEPEEQREAVAEQVNRTDPI